MIEPVVLLVLAVIIGILSFILVQVKKTDSRARPSRQVEAPKKKEKPCPLCGSMLKKGQTVKTVIYPAKGDTLAEVFGCPYCYGDRADAVRICPVCKKPVPEGGYVIGRMFKEGRHLHVLGCTACRKKR